MLTEDMTRLCGEIVAMRRRRGALMNDMAQQNQHRKQSVAEFCAHASGTRAGMARRTKGERRAFLHNLKRTVGAQRREMNADLAGVRRAWSGKSA